MGIFVWICLILLPSMAIGRSFEPQGEECNRFLYEYKIMERLIKLEMDNNDLKQRISHLETTGTGQPPAVAVKVRRSVNQDLSVNQRVMYDVEMWNVGEAFDLTTGQFVAPVTGIYFIDVHTCLNAGGQWMDLDLVKDGAKIGRVFSGDHSYHNCGSEAVALRLEQGDKVWVQRTTGSATIINQDHGWNSFTAALVMAE